MEIEFGNSKLQKRCENRKEAVRAWGETNARKVLQRLQEIHAAENLELLYKVPAARCHKLKADRDGQFAVSLVQPYRLIFEPAGDPASYTDGGCMVPSKITQVRILEVIDYHD